MLSSIFEECWTRWMMDLDTQTLNRRGKCAGDKNVLACVRKTKERFEQLRERVELGGLLTQGTVIVDPARLGVKRLDEDSKKKIQGALEGRPRSERRVAERFKITGGDMTGHAR